MLRVVVPILLLAVLTAVVQGRAMSPVGLRCPEGWTKVDSSCYLYVQVRRTFLAATLDCGSLGGNLVEIESDAEDQLVCDMVKATGDRLAVWIGLSNAVTEEKYVWQGSYKEATFTDFRPPQPNSSGDCVELKVDRAAPEWNDDRCTRRNSYVCEREAHRGFTRF